MTTLVSTPEQSEAAELTAVTAEEQAQDGPVEAARVPDSVSRHERADCAAQVFLSYRSEDKYAAYRLCAALERQNISCWIAPRNIPVGHEWPAAIVEAIGACKVFVMVLSSNSRNAKQIAREAELADKNGCQIITFRIEDVEPPPGLSYFLGNIQWLDAFGDHFDEAVKELAQLTAAAGPGVGRAAGFAPLMMNGRSGPSKQSAPGDAGLWLSILALAVICVVALGCWLGGDREGKTSVKKQHEVVSEKVTFANVEDVRLPDAIDASEDARADGKARAQAFVEHWLSEREAGKMDPNKPKQAHFHEHGVANNELMETAQTDHSFVFIYRISYGDGTQEYERMEVTPAGGRFHLNVTRRKSV